MTRYLRGAFIVWIVLRHGLDELVLSSFRGRGIRLLTRIVSIGRNLDAPRGERLGVSPSALSFHLKELAHAELVSTEMVVFEWLRSAEHPAFKAMLQLVNFFIATTLLSRSMFFLFMANGAISKQMLKLPFKQAFLVRMHSL